MANVNNPYTKSVRQSLLLSQVRLARLSGVSRFKICLFECGDGSLSENELARIGAVLEVESQRLKNDEAHRFEIRAQVGEALNLARERDYPIVQYYLSAAHEILGLPADRYAVRPGGI